MVSNALLQRSSSPVRWWGQRRSPICSAGTRTSAASRPAQARAGPESSRRRRSLSRPGPLVLSPVRTGLLPRAAAAGRQFASLRPAKLVRLAPRTPRRPARSRRLRTPSTPGSGDPGGSRRTGDSGRSGRSGARRPAPTARRPRRPRRRRPRRRAPARAADAGPEPGPGDDAADLAPVAPGAADRGARAGARDRAGRSSRSGPILPTPGPTLPVDSTPATSPAASTDDGAQDGGNG